MYSYFKESVFLSRAKVSVSNRFGNATRESSLVTVHIAYAESSLVVGEKRKKAGLQWIPVSPRPRHSAFTLLFRHCSSQAREYRRARLISLT